MFYTIIQYVFIAAVFGIAVWYVIKMGKDSFGSKDKGCGKGCGCDTNSKSKEDSSLN